MTQATATTAIKAVRQHGGGLVHANRPRATLRGRHQCPSGGAINRRCAAASIIALASSASATLAYPTTCVRRAQKLSTLLRSTTRPPAQLVVGYKNYPSSPLLSMVIEQQLQVFLNFNFGSSQVLQLSFYCFKHPISSRGRHPHNIASQGICDISTEASRVLYFKQIRNHLSTNGIDWEGAHLISISLEVFDHQHGLNTIIAKLDFFKIPDETCKQTILMPHKGRRRVVIVYSQTEVLFLTLLLLVCFLPSRNTHSDPNAQKGANRLNPGSGDFVVWPTERDKPNQQRDGNPEGCRHNNCRNYVSTQFHTHLPPVYFTPSLAGFLRRVQKVAA